MTLAIQTSDIVAKASARINKYIHNTPLLYSETLNKMVGNNVYFKMDAMQKTGSFKLRGVLNNLIALHENHGTMPGKIVAYSTGNHALAMSYAAQLFKIHARVYLPQNVAPIKKRIAKHYGAEVMEVATRIEAEELSQKDGENGFYYLPTSDSDEIIAGAGTMCYEALITMKERGVMPDAIFASCGGGGLLSGTYLAKELLSPSSKVIGVEPSSANDAHLSLQFGKINRFQKSPITIADGLTALSVSERTFNYLKKLDEFYICNEELICYWTAWLMQLMKVTCEPSAAISMAGAAEWIKQNNYSNKTILVLISGGNIDPSLHLKLWNQGYLEKIPEITTKNKTLLDI